MSAVREMRQLTEMSAASVLATFRAPGVTLGNGSGTHTPSVTRFAIDSSRRFPVKTERHDKRESTNVHA